MSDAHFVTDIAVVMGVGAVTAYAARRLGQPTILGYLLAGLIVGPYLDVPVFADPERVTALGEFGVVLVMFAVGLEFRLAKLLRVLPTAGLTGAIQIATLLFCGFYAGQLLGWDSVGSVFLGACIAISSTMVVSKVFAQQERLDPNVRDHVLGILVIQDVVAIVLIAAMTGVAAGGGLAPGDLGLTLAKLAGVLFALLVGGLLVVPPIMRRVARLKSVELDAVVSIGLCFGFALLAESLGYSVALGAFLAGILVAESGLGEQIEHTIQPTRDMFAAIFFVSIGMTVDPRQAWEHILVSLFVFVVVVLAQFLSVSIASILSGNGLKPSVVAGLSLGQIGEFAFIIAAIGTGANVVPDSLQPVLVTVALLTSFTTPLALKSAGRVVHAIDAGLPRRLRSLINLHAEWVERIRSREPVQSAPIRRAVLALLLDSVGLLLLLGAIALIRSPALNWLSNVVSLELERARLGLIAGALFLAAPLIVGAARNARAFAGLRAQTLHGPGESPQAIQASSRALSAMLTVLILAAVALPFTAALALIVGGKYIVPALVIGVIVVSLYLWRTAKDAETEFESGVKRIGDVLSLGQREVVEDRLSMPALLPGLDDVVLVRISDSGPTGKTLAELDLRARSGATVVALRREGGGRDVAVGH